MQHISYTAAYAEMSRWIDQGIAALELRNLAVAQKAFAQAADLAVSANLGPKVIAGTRRNLAMAYRTAGHLAEAEETYRALLGYPHLPPEQAPYVLHGLGETLALAGNDEAETVLAEALRTYSKRQDVLSAALDLAEFRFDRGRHGQAYRELAALLLPEDETQHAALWCQAQLLLARCLLAEGRVEQARAHLADPSAHAADAPVLRSLYLGVLAQLAGASGDDQQAKALAVEALETAMDHTELHTAQVLQKTVRVFLRLHGR